MRISVFNVLKKCSIREMIKRTFFNLITCYKISKCRIVIRQFILQFTQCKMQITSPMLISFNGHARR